MGNYATTVHSGMENSLALALAALDTLLNTTPGYDTAKTIRLMDVYQVGNQWAYALIIDS
jgi:hypothetical protein